MSYLAMDNSRNQNFISLWFAIIFIILLCGNFFMRSIIRVMTRENRVPITTAVPISIVEPIMIPSSVDIRRIGIPRLNTRNNL